MQAKGRRILRAHSVFLMILTPSVTIAACVGVFTSRGPYGGLADTPIAIIGLAQAYPLMGLIAVAMWVGARGPAPGQFSSIAIAAHCVPLSVLAVFWKPILESSIAPAIPFSLVIHVGGILAEMFSLWTGYGESTRRDHV